MAGRLDHGYPDGHEDGGQADAEGRDEQEPQLEAAELDGEQ